MLRGVSRIIVVGAGIGGLCAARAVALAGHEPVVLERSPAGTAIGAGLALWPNAMHALAALGAEPAVLAAGARAERGSSGGPAAACSMRWISALWRGGPGRRW